MDHFHSSCLQGACWIATRTKSIAERGWSARRHRRGRGAVGWSEAVLLHSQLPGWRKGWPSGWGGQEGNGRKWQEGRRDGWVCVRCSPRCLPLSWGCPTFQWEERVQKKKWVGKAAKLAEEWFLISSPRCCSFLRQLRSGIRAGNQKNRPIVLLALCPPGVLLYVIAYKTTFVMPSINKQLVRAQQNRSHKIAFNTSIYLLGQKNSSSVSPASVCCPGCSWAPSLTTQCVQMPLLRACPYPSTRALISQTISLLSWLGFQSNQR